MMFLRATSSARYDAMMDRNHKAMTVLLLAGIALVLGVYFYFAASNPNSGSFSDSVRYLFMAEHFRGGSDALTVKMAGESMFPPLYPLILGLLGAGTGAIPAAHVVTVLVLAFSCLACFWWLGEQQLSINARLQSLLLFLLLPGVFFQGLIITSEFLFLATLLASLAAMEKSRSADAWIGLAALLVGLSIATRTVGIALLPSLFLACRSMGYRKIILAAILSLAPYLLWQLLRDGSLAGRGYLGVYSLYMEQFSLSDIMRNTGIQLQEIWKNWIRIFDRSPASHVVLLHTLLLISVAPVFFARLARLRYEAVFLLFYLGIITLWPFPRELERFVVILVPFFLFYCVWAIQFLIRKLKLFSLDALLTTALFAAIFISAAPSLGLILDRYRLPAPPELGSHRYSKTWYEYADNDFTVFTARKLENLYRLLNEVEEHIGEEECVYTTLRDLVSLYSQREGRHPPKDLYRSNGDQHVPASERLDQCDYILMVALHPVQLPDYVSMYPLEALDQQMEPVLYSRITHDGAEKVVAIFAEIVRSQN